MAQNFTLPKEGPCIALPNGKALTLILSVFTVGSLTCLVFALAALIGAVYLAILAVHAMAELAAQFAALYAQSDSALRLLVWLLCVWLLIKLSPIVARSVRSSFERVFSA